MNVMGTLSKFSSYSVTRKTDLLRCRKFSSGKWYSASSVSLLDLGEENMEGFTA